MGFMDELLKGAPAQAAARGEDGAGQPIPSHAVSEPEAPKGDLTPDKPEATAASGDAAPVTEPEDDDGETPAPDERGHVPLAAYQAERRKRQDYKTQAAVQAEAVRRLEAQLAEAKSGKVEAQQTRQRVVAPPGAPNPVEDPEGFIKHTQAIAEKTRLDSSEAMVREHYGDEKVEAAFEVFKDACKINPSLYAETMAKQSPWSHLVKIAETLKEDVAISKEGAAAYRARIVAEERAKWDQERSEGAPASQAAPAVNVNRPPPSLSTARSTGSGKASPAFAGPTPLGALVGRNSAVGSRR